jgi:hypothetical protein
MLLRGNQYLLLLLNAACLAEKQQIPILQFWFDQTGIEPMNYHTQGEQANHDKPDCLFGVYLPNKFPCKTFYQ